MSQRISFVQVFLTVRYTKLVVHVKIPYTNAVRRAHCFWHVALFYIVV